MTATTAPARPAAAGRPAPTGSAGAGALGRHVLGTEVRRTGAVLVAGFIAVAGAAVLSAKLLPFSTRGSWDPTWFGALSWIDNAGAFFGPLAAMVGAWAGGRERRRGIEELLVVTPRPPWQRVCLTWTAVVAGVVAGFLAQAALVLAAVLPAVSYGGGRWPQGLGLIVLGMLVCTTWGFAVGRSVPGRLVAPLVGVAGYVALGWLGLSGPVRRLLPVSGLLLGEGEQLHAAVLVGLAEWLAALTVTALVLAAARRRRWALVPALVALVVVVPLVRVDVDPAESWTVADAAAEQMVCTRDGGPEVCVQRVHAGLLGAVVPLVREQMGSVHDLVSWSSAREPVTGRAPAAGVLALPPLQGRGRPFSSGLADPARYRAQVLDLASAGSCALDATGGATGGAATAAAAAAAAVDDAVAAALLHHAAPDPAAGSGASALHGRLAADPAAARSWMRDYLAAAPACDLPVLQRLAGR